MRQSKPEKGTISVTTADEFSTTLMEEAKRFLEKASLGESAEQEPYLHAALLVGFCALESHLNGVVEELSMRLDTNLLDLAMLNERGVRIEGGDWALGERRFYRLEDRVQFLFLRYGSVAANELSWWADLQSATRARNNLVHPRDYAPLVRGDVERYLQAILEALNDLYRVLFSNGHPAYGRGLHSTMSF